MSRGISRKNHIFIDRQADLNNCIQYVRYLKSRIYKAYINEVGRDIYKFSYQFMQSPYVLFVAVKQMRDSMEIDLNVFELGYFVSFGVQSKTIQSISFYYRGDRSNRLKRNIDLLVNGVKYYLINWLIEVQKNYLYYINNSLIFGLYMTDSFSNLLLPEFYDYGLIINLKAYLSNISVTTILDKFNNLYYKYTICLLEPSFIKEWIKWFSKSSSFIILQPKNLLFTSITELLVLYVCYEISIMVRNAYEIIDDSKCGLLLNSNYLLISSQNPLVLYQWRKSFIYFLISKGIKLRYMGISDTNSLYYGLQLREYFIQRNIKTLSYYFIVKPSLYYQYLLIKQISILFMCSRSQLMFLSFIRINKLLLVWSYSYRRLNVKKLFILLDYLIYIKWRFLFKASNIPSQKKICLEFLLNKSIINRSMKKIYWHTRTIIYGNLNYKQYIILKLVWLLQ